MTIVLLLTALSLSAIAAFYAVSGLVAIFASAAVPIAIMGTVLEASKLVVASWLYRRWNDVSFLTKTYFTTALIVLMLLTSMGIFGYLSKAHLDQAGQSGTNEIQIAQIERQIEREKKKITDAELVISQLDAAVQTLIDFDRIRGPEGAIAVRESQKDERESLIGIIESATAQIVGLEERLIPLNQEKLALELEVGPLKYVAELIYGDEAEGHFDEAVRWVILLIIFVFDPLAVMMVIAWNREVVLSERKKPEPLPEVVEEPKPKPKKKKQEEPVKQVNTTYWEELQEKKQKQWEEIEKAFAEPEVGATLPLDEVQEPLNNVGSDIYESVARGKQGRPERWSNK